MRRSARLCLDPLDPRLVPAALDLTARGASAAAGAGIVAQSDAQPTGTGVIHSFVRLQGPANGGTEQGYNTAARPLQFDENKSPSFTRPLTVGDVPVVTVGGVRYREFLLDVNQKASASKLSLDEVRVYLTDRPDATGYNTTAKTLDGKAAVYDLDAGEDRTVLLDARLNSGSGSGDMRLLVPDAAFAGAALGTYVNLFSRFGGAHQANGGFEEWAVRVTGAATPPPPAGTASLSGAVYFDADEDGTFDPDENGIGGVTIQLQGVNDLGQTVVFTTVTAADGSYSFAGLRAGTYSIFQVQPEDYWDGVDTAGNLGGVTTPDGAPEGYYEGIVEINVTAGAVGVGYNFGEFLPFGGGTNT